GGAEGLLHAGLVALARELAHDPHADALQIPAGALAGGGHHIRDRHVETGGVARVVAGDHLVEQCRVLDRPATWAGLVGRRGGGDEPLPRDGAVGGFDPDRRGEGGGLADRAAGVGADGDRRLVGGQRRGRAAPGTAGRAGVVPRVAGRAVCRVLRR